MKLLQILILVEYWFYSYLIHSVILSRSIPVLSLRLSCDTDRGIGEIIIPYLNVGGRPRSNKQSTDPFISVQGFYSYDKKSTEFEVVQSIRPLTSTTWFPNCRCCPWEQNTGWECKCSISTFFQNKVDLVLYSWRCKIYAKIRMMYCIEK